MQVVKVDHLDLQALQAFLAGLFQPLRRAIEVALLAIGQAAFGGQDDFVAAWPQHCAHQPLIMSKPIDRGGVEECVAGIQRAQQHALGRIARWRGAIGVRQAHAAQADLRDGEGTQFALLHCPLRICRTALT